jgi:hypothetical protein
VELTHPRDTNSDLSKTSQGGGGREGEGEEKRFSFRIINFNGTHILWRQQRLLLAFSLAPNPVPRINNNPNQSSVSLRISFLE